MIPNGRQREEHISELEYPSPGKCKEIMDVTWYLESTLALLVRSLGGHVEGSDMRKVAYRILCGLASDYVDGIVLKAADYWDIEYERRERNGQGVVTVLDSLKGADN